MSSAGKGGQIACLKQRLVFGTPVFGAHLKCKLLHSLQRVDKSLFGGPIQVLHTPNVDGYKPGRVARVINYLQSDRTFGIEYPLVVVLFCILH